MDPRTVTNLRDKKVQFRCPICDLIIKDAEGKKQGEDSVECDGNCATWLHRKCAGLSKEAFKSVCESDKPFYCPQCRLDKQELEIMSLRDLVSKLSSKLSLVCNELDSLKNSSPSSNGVHSENNNESYSSVVSGSKSPSSKYETQTSANTPDRSSKSNNNQLGHSIPTSTSERRSNLVIYGLTESNKGTLRHLRNRHDIESAGKLLSTVDPFVTENLICDCFRLGKFQDSRSRPLLVKLTRPNDVQSILMNRKKLSSSPGFAIKPDMSVEDRKTESLLLKERRTLIDSGVERSTIRISGNSIFVNRRKYGVVTNASFQKCPLVKDSLPDIKPQEDDCFEEQASLPDIRPQVNGCYEEQAESSPTTDQQDNSPQASDHIESPVSAEHATNTGTM